jgi:hypothetical protein
VAFPNWFAGTQKNAPDSDRLWSELLDDGAVPITDRRADCCVARPAFRVVLPASSATAQAGELLLCGHHYRRSAELLEAKDAVVYDEHNQPVRRWVATAVTPEVAPQPLTPR